MGEDHQSHGFLLKAEVNNYFGAATASESKPDFELVDDDEDLLED